MIKNKYFEKVEEACKWANENNIDVINITSNDLTCEGYELIYKDNE